MKENKVSEIKNLIFDGFDVNKKLKIGTLFGYNLPIHIVCFSKRLEMVKILIEAGADVNKARSDGMNALLAACAQDKEEIVNLILPLIKDIDYLSQSGTALKIACVYKHAAIAKLLIEHGADISLIGKQKKYSSQIQAVLGSAKKTSNQLNNTNITPSTSTSLPQKNERLRR